jgi:hypothetical protein
VIDDANSESKGYISLESLRGSGIHEVFIFRNRSAAASWGFLGWSPSNCKDMIHVLANHENEVTLVVETTRDPELAKIVQAVRDAVGEPQML